MNRSSFTSTLVSIYLAAHVLAVPGAPASSLFVATPLTEPNSFTIGVEGPACDSQGNIYAVNFGVQQTIGKINPGGAAEVFVTLPGRSVGNGIRFSSTGMMYVADYIEHNVLKIDPTTRAISVYAHEPAMNQPNDLAVAPDGVLYASDPDWKNKHGQIWRIATTGTVTRVARDMGTTNGIEVSPDGKSLYVNESVQRNIWAFDITPGGGLSNQRLIRQFTDYGFDGMRCDIDGTLYITRHGKGTVIKMTPEGEILREIAVLGGNPTNICFGGPDGCTAYVTEAEQRRIVQFRVDRPGLEWARRHKR
jgi:gluconolactonase